MLILSLLFVLVDLNFLPLWMILLVLFRELLVTGIRQVCSKPTQIVGANWMGKTKFLIQAGVILYFQIFLYLFYSGKSLFVFQPLVGYYLALIMVILSLIFGLNFLYWHRKEIFSGI